MSSEEKKDLVVGGCIRVGWVLGCVVVGWNPPHPPKNPPGWVVFGGSLWGFCGGGFVLVWGWLGGGGEGGGVRHREQKAW